MQHQITHQQYKKEIVSLLESLSKGMKEEHANLIKLICIKIKDMDDKELNILKNKIDSFSEVLQWSKSQNLEEK
jgi:hypothetical protein